MSVDNSEDLIDSREAISYLQELRENVESALDSGSLVSDVDADEYDALWRLNDEGESFSDWKHGITLIRASYFKEYAKELAEDCGMVSGTESWPLNCIDWDEAADELQSDYSEIEFDGISYFLRG